MEIIGYVLIILSGVFIGAAVSSSLKEEIDECEALLELVRYIEAKIKYYKEPLPSIFSNYSDKRLSKSGFLELLQKQGFLEAILKSKMQLDDKTRNVLVAFGKELGKSSADEQQLNCGYAIEQLSNRLEYMKKEYPNKRKMYFTLCVAAAITIVIILI